MGPKKKKIVAEVGVVLVATRNFILSYAYSLIEPCSINIVLSNALLIGLQLAKEVRVKYLKVYGDSKLIVKSKENTQSIMKTVPYHQASIELTNIFHYFYISYVSRRENMHIYWHHLQPSWMYRTKSSTHFYC